MIVYIMAFKVLLRYFRFSFRFADIVVLLMSLLIISLPVIKVKRKEKKISRVLTIFLFGRFQVYFNKFRFELGGDLLVVND